MKRLLFLFLVGCGSTSVSDAGSDAASDAGSDVTNACSAAQATPGQLPCGSATCTTPAQVCCYDGTPHCTDGASCNAPSMACDEDTDCAASGMYCCTGLVPLQADGGSFGITQGTGCTSDPTLCLPQQGVGNSSAEACQVDSECHGTDAGCIAQTCSGQCIHACEKMGNCN